MTLPACEDPQALKSAKQIISSVIVNNDQALDFVFNHSPDQYAEILEACPLESRVILSKHTQQETIQRCAQYLLGPTRQAAHILAQGARSDGSPLSLLAGSPELLELCVRETAPSGFKIKPLKEPL